MEYASLLAGEPCSDHPGCTHPALAQLARLVNDVLPPPARQRLAPLTPEMIGLAGHDPRVTPRDPRRVGGYGSPARRPDAVSGRWPAPVSRLAAAG